MRTVTKLPPLTDAIVGETFSVVDADGLFWGEFKACRNWCREVFWLDLSDA